MISRIEVDLNFGNTKLKVGELLEDRGQIHFVYDETFPSEKYRISPFKLSSDKSTVHVVEERDLRLFNGVYGVFADSMPDGWGLLLIKRTIEARGLSFFDLSPLDILTYVGSSGIGALEFRPVNSDNSKKTDLSIDLEKIGLESRKIFEGEESAILGTLLKLGGSPGGARPKILVAINDNDSQKIVIKSDSDKLTKGFEHWMIKFVGKDDSELDTIFEFHYMQTAEKLGINVPKHRLLRDGKNSYFAVKRFDRCEEGSKLHTQSLAGLIHADFRLPAIDYKDFLKVIQLLTQSHSQVEMGYRMAVFNVLFHNQDDHSKNFSFLMDSEGKWSLAPAYDLTFSRGPGGEHSTSVMGFGKKIGKSKLIELAEIARISKKKAETIISETEEARSLLRKELASLGMKKHPLIIAKEWFEG